jgi:hypothetical protein
MGSLCTEFQAEMMAILKFAELFLCKNVTRRKRRSCCGSRSPVAVAAVAATATLAKTSNKSAVLRESIQAPEQLSGSSKSNFAVNTRAS